MKSLLVIALALTSTLACAQDFGKLANVEITEKSQCKPIEPEVLKCAQYLFSNPSDTETDNRKIATRIIIMWMSATPDYQFGIDNTAGDLMKGNDEILGLIMAAMTKTALENPEVSKDQAALKLSSYTTLLKYCDDAANKVKQTKNLKKALEAYRGDKLKAYLNL